MKNLAKLTLLAASCAILGTTAAFADSAENQTRLNMVDRQITATPQTVSVAAYSDQRGLGRNTMSNSSSCSMKSYRLRDDAHGHLQVLSTACNR